MGVHASSSILLISVLTLAFSGQVIDQPTPEAVEGGQEAIGPEPRIGPHAHRAPGPGPSHTPHCLPNEMDHTPLRCSFPQTGADHFPVSARNANSG